MRRSLVLVSLLASVFLAGCSTLGVVQLSSDTYMLSRVEGKEGNGDVAALRAAVVKDANDFAARKGKVAIPLSTYTSPAAPGHLASVEYQFKLLAKDDPEAKAATLTPAAEAAERTETFPGNPGIMGEAPKPPDLYAELIKLDDLRKKGIITDAEFESEKKKLLNRSR